MIQEANSEYETLPLTHAYGGHMVEVKGTVVIDSVNSVKSRNGEQVYNTIVGQLTGDTRSLFEKTNLLPFSWYPLDAFVEFLEADLKATAQGNEKELIKRSEVIIEKQLGGIYKMFIKFGSPRFVLNRLSAVHQTYFRGVAAEVSFPSEGKAIIKYTGFAKTHRLIGLSIIGFYRRAMEISGAKDLKCEFTVPIEAEKGYCELTLSWTGK